MNIVQIPELHVEIELSNIETYYFPDFNLTTIFSVSILLIFNCYFIQGVTP